MDFEKLASEVGFETNEYVELISLFVSTTEGDIDKLKTALKNGDCHAAERAAHSMKGASSSLGLNEFSGKAKEIEYAAKDGPARLSGISCSELEAMLGGIKENLKTHTGK